MEKKPINYDKISLESVNDFDLAWWDKGSGADRDGAFYNPVLPPGYYSLGSYGQGNYDSPTGSVLVAREIEPGTLAHPTHYQLVYRDKGSGAVRDGSFWLPVPPSGYSAMGILCVSGYDMPPDSAVMCVRKDCVVEAGLGKLIWDDKGSGAQLDGGFWSLKPIEAMISTGLFAGAGNYTGEGAMPLVGFNPDCVSL